MARAPKPEAKADALSREAFEMAKQVAAGAPGDPLIERARALSAEVDELRAKAAADEGMANRAAVQRVLSEAANDLRYVLAGGKGPTSIRLHHHIGDSA